MLVAFVCIARLAPITSFPGAVQHSGSGKPAATPRPSLAPLSRAPLHGRCRPSCVARGGGTAAWPPCGGWSDVAASAPLSGRALHARAHGRPAAQPGGHAPAPASAHTAHASAAPHPRLLPACNERKRQGG
eukprot:365985-Chlamydomonas_euryale.AAC.7